MRKYEISDHPDKIVIVSRVGELNSIQLVCWFEKKDSNVAKAMCRILNSETSAAYDDGYRDAVKHQIVQEMNIKGERHEQTGSID